jgi:hypothetical protein
MPIEREPRDPLPSGYVPPGGIPYQVKDGDDWATLASKAGIDNAWALIEYNFKTLSPSEVNWYLHNRVGCVQTTQDGKNWIFSSGAAPGKIHFPPKRKNDGAVGSGEYEMRPEDCLASVAYRHGHVWQTLWFDSQNAEVRQARGEPKEIRSGDRIHIPEVRLKLVSGATEQKHRFSRTSQHDFGRLDILTDFRPGEVAHVDDSFTLTGSGGKKPYKATVSVKDDHYAGDHGIILTFRGLPMDATYTLEVKLADGSKLELFKDVPFDQLQRQSSDLERHSLQAN